MKTLDEEVDFIPLKNLPESGLTVYHYKNKKGSPNKTEPDDVLVSGIGRFDEVSLVGRTKEGSFYFASSIEEPSEIMKDLKNFKKVLKDYM